VFVHNDGNLPDRIVNHNLIHCHKYWDFYHVIFIIYVQDDRVIVNFSSDAVRKHAMLEWWCVL
jgi:hypothetical protein